MSPDRERIGELLRASAQVFASCTHGNGAIVAAPCADVGDAAETKDYGYVWPRDVLYITRAARRLGVELVPSFLVWLRRAEAWAETGLFYKKYRIDGSLARRRWQPDQTAAVLTMVRDATPDGVLLPSTRDLLVRTADALASRWTGECLDRPSQELWEQRIAFPDLAQNFTYTLAAMARGLLDAHALVPTGRWHEVATGMLRVLDQSWPDGFGRTSGHVRDERIDASLLALDYPFGAVSARDPRYVRTVERILERLWYAGGVHRFEGDDYDGWLAPDGTARNIESGHWPLLGFWLAIALQAMARTEDAIRVYGEMLATADARGHFPEQVHANPLASSVRPLAWSHAMFVLATDVIVGEDVLRA